jgi:hypothetical protein
MCSTRANSTPPRTCSTRADTRSPGNRAGHQRDLAVVTREHPAAGGGLFDGERQDVSGARHSYSTGSDGQACVLAHEAVEGRVDSRASTPRWASDRGKGRDPPLPAPFRLRESAAGSPARRRSSNCRSRLARRSTIAARAAPRACFAACQHLIELADDAVQQIGGYRRVAPARSAVSFAMARSRRVARLSRGRGSVVSSDALAVTPTARRQASNMSSTSCSQ